MGLTWFHTEENDVHALSAIIGGFVLLFGFVSLIIKERLYLSESLVATLVGIVIGPICIGILNPLDWEGETHKVTLAFSEFVISIQVMAAAIALPRGFWKEHRASLALLYGPVMLWMWLISALLLWLILRVSWAQSLVLAACLAPTDPVLANSIVTGRFADKYISVPIRNLLSAESAANDGLAIPFFQLGILLLQVSPKEAWGMWFYRVLLYEIGVGIVFGVIIGFSAKIALRASEKRNYIDKRSFLSVEIALALFVLGLSSMLHLASFLVVFVTGLVFAWDGWFTEETLEAHVQEVVDNLINLTFFIYFGAIIPWSTFNTFHSLPTLLLLSVALLLLRRLPPVILLHHYLPRPAILTRRESLLVGYFGPIGVGAVWYICYAHKTGVIGDEGVSIVMWVVWCSVVVYGITAVLMHGLVRTLSVVRVYSGRSFNGRTLSLPSDSRGVAAWPSNVPITAGQISGPIISPNDLIDIQTNTRVLPNRPGSDTEGSGVTITIGDKPPGILVKSDVDLEGDNSKERLTVTNTTYSTEMLKTGNENQMHRTLNDLDQAKDCENADFHDVIHVSPVPASLSQDSPPVEGELGIPPGSVTEVASDVREDVLVGVGVRFRTFDTR